MEKQKSNVLKQIYKITNLINGKIYIGQHNGKRNNYFGSGKILKVAIKKYGKQNFKKEIIIEGNFNQSFIDYLETHYIQLYASRVLSKGYNLRVGGFGNKGNKMSDETKKKLSDFWKGKKKPERTLEHRINLGNSLKGRISSKETKEKRSKSISLALTGKKLSDSHKENLRLSHLGYKMPDSQKEKIRLSNKDRGGIPIIIFDLNNNFIKECVSLSEAAKFIKTDVGNITYCCKGKYKQIKGYITKYK